MIALVITGLFGIAAWCAFSNGETGAGIICVVIILLAWGLLGAAVEDGKASVNRRTYWAKSGKDRAKLRHKWEAEAREEEALERAEAERRAAERAVRNAKRELRELEARKRELEGSGYRIVPGEPDGTARRPEARQAGGYVGNAAVRDGKQMRRFVCHACGSQVIAANNRKQLWDGRVVSEFYCPKCRVMRQTAI